MKTYQNQKEYSTTLTDSIDTPRLYLKWRENPWDTVVLGSSVLEITKIIVKDVLAKEDYSHFEYNRDKLSTGLVSCRLPNNCLSESIFLEDNGFKFIEMVYQPELLGLQELDFGQNNDVRVQLAAKDELKNIIKIASNAFLDDRFHLDPRIDSTLGDIRYSNWVRNSLHHNSQLLYSFIYMEKTIGFFISEMLDDTTCYWHLTAVDQKFQGKGLGRKVWEAMLSLLKETGVDRVRSCISARNYKVIHLYTSMGFKLAPPLMTFHWVKQ